MIRCSLIAMVVVAQLLAQAAAEVPQQISYQGRLTDAAGAPVDTTADLTIVICQDEAGSVPLWGETHLGVSVVDGLFDLVLGSVNPIADGVFDGSIRWLGVQIEGGPLSTPLMPTVSTPYAIRAINADTAAYALNGAGAGGWIDDGSTVRLETATDYVGIGTSTPNEPLVIGKDLGANNGDFIVVGNDTPDRWSGVLMGEDADNNARIYWYNNQDALAFVTREAGNFQDGIVLTGGQVGIGTDVPGFKLEVKSDGVADGMRVTGSNGALLFRVRENSNTSGEIHIGSDNGNASVVLRGVGDSYFAGGNVGIGTTTPDCRLHVLGSGNSSVQLPTDAISSAEMFNEPGVGNSATKTTVDLDGTYKTIRSRECTFPSAGYVVAIATCKTITWLDGVHSEEIYLGISDAPGSTPDYEYIKSYLVTEPCCQHIETITFHRLFEVSAGTRTFFFQGRCTNSLTDVNPSELTIMFFPTAYGSVSPIAETPGEDGEFSTAATPVSLDQGIVEDRVRTQAEAMEARLEAKLAETREDLEALKAEIATLKQSR